MGSRNIPVGAGYGLAAVILAACLPVGAAGPGATGEVFPDYNPAHTVIKCPYIPRQLESTEIPTCNGVVPNCVGTGSHDLIMGTELDDVIIGRGGNDTIHGDGGHDIICGGSGNDSLHGAKGADNLLGESGDDFLFGGPGKDTLYGGPGDFDVLWGGRGLDMLDGGAGAFDICMLQRELGNYDDEGCNSVYPPPGYVHDEEPDPGILGLGHPQQSH